MLVRLMYTLTDIERICGRPRAEYVRRKQIGGVSGQKGTRFEDWLAVFRIAETCRAAFEQGQGRFVKRRNATFYGQVQCFVDDLVVRRSHRLEVIHYQAKNRQSASWGTRGGSLRRDFIDQKLICEDQTLCYQLVLVVSNLANSRRLASKIPQELIGKGSVLYFPYRTRLSELLRAHASFREALQDMTPYTSASMSDLEATGLALLGVWINAGNRISAQRAMAKMMEGRGPLVRPLNPVTRLRPKLTAVLDSIPGFHYHLEKGFLHWRYGRTDSGCYRYHCGSSGFGKFAVRQIARQPRTFEELEGELGP